MTFIANIIETSDAPGLFAIRPGAWLSEFGALVLEEYSLHMLKNDLHRLSFILNVQKTLGNFEKQAELTGVWLRVIHKNTNHGQTQYFDSLNIIENLHKEIAFLEKLSGSSLDYLGRKFRALSKSLENYDVPFAALHNDFHLGNIFVLDDGRVGALDPNWVESGTVYKDLSSLLIDPLTRKMQVASAGLLFRRHMYDRFEKAVLRGYFGDSKVPMSMICFYCAVNVIEKWRMDEELLSAGRTKVQSFIFRLGKPAVRYYFRKLILTYLDRGIASLNGSTND
jgi:thiamine kinase-like enzyme